MPLLGETEVYQLQNVGFRIPIHYKTALIEGNALDDFHLYIKDLPSVFRLINIPYQTEYMLAPSYTLEWQEEGMPIRDLIWLVHLVDDRGEKIEPIGYYFLKFPKDKGRITF